MHSMGEPQKSIKIQTTSYKQSYASISTDTYNVFHKIYLDETYLSLLMVYRSTFKK